MSCSRTVVVRCRCVLVAILTLGTVAASPALAQSEESDQAQMPGRVEFDFPNAPVATVEVDLNHGLLSAITGIGQAAIRGAAEALLESPDVQAAVPVQQSAEHLQAVNEIVEALSGVVHEVRVRVYEKLSERAPTSSAAMTSHYHQMLQGSHWDSVIRVRDGADSVTVNVLRRREAIRGLFVVVSEDSGLVLVNVVCDLSPERVKQVTHQATKIGLEFGLDKAIQKAMEEIERELQ